MAFSFFGFWYNLKKKLHLSFQSYWRYSPNRWYFFSIIIMQALIWFFAYRIFYLVGAELFVSHYNVDFGIDGIGPSTRVFEIPSIVLIISIFNFILLLSFGRKNIFHFLVHAVGLTSVAVQFLAALSLMSLYLINFIA